MNFNLLESDKDRLVEIIFYEFIKLNKKSNNFNIKTKIDDTLFDVKYDDSKKTDDSKYNKSPIIDNLSSFFLDKVFSDPDLIIYFQRNINIYFNALVERYKEYINNKIIGDVEDNDKELLKLRELNLSILNSTDILFIWKGSTAMKTIYNKYSRLLDTKVNEKYDKYFSKKSDADCAIFINPNNKNAEFHRNNMIILSFLMLNWLRKTIMMDAINNIMRNISFNINYDNIRKDESKGEIEWGKDKKIKKQTWSFSNIGRLDRIIVPSKDESMKINYTKYNLNNEDYINDAGSIINYYENTENSFFLSIHNKTLSNIDKCNGFNKNFSLIKLKYDIICSVDIIFKDNTTKTIHYLLSNDIIDMAVRTIDDDSLKKDYEDINAITQVYNKVSFASNKKFNFRSYTLDGFIMDFIYNLFKTPSKYGGCNPLYVPKYENNLNRFFYFILLKLLYMNSNNPSKKAGFVMCDLLIENIRTIIFKDPHNIKKTNDMVFEYFLKCISDLRGVFDITYYKNKKEIKYKFIDNILDELRFIKVILSTKSDSLVKENPSMILNLNKYMKYKTKYLQLKNLINN
jgi:hypothetical protein